jgi:hypothetical protein
MGKEKREKEGGILGTKILEKILKDFGRFWGQATFFYIFWIFVLKSRPSLLNSSGLDFAPLILGRKAGIWYGTI